MSIHNVGAITNARQPKHAVHHSALTILRHVATDRDFAVGVRMCPLGGAADSLTSNSSPDR